MKDSLLCVHIVVKTLNLEISRRHLADYVKELSVLPRSLFSGVVVAFATVESLLKLPNLECSELKTVFGCLGLKIRCQTS